MEKPTAVPHTEKGSKNISITVHHKTVLLWIRNDNDPDPDLTFQVVPDPYPTWPTSPGSDQIRIHNTVTKYRYLGSDPGYQSTMRLGASLSYLLYTHDRKITVQGHTVPTYVMKARKRIANIAL
jgi:hypothetical protein